MYSEEDGKFWAIDVDVAKGVQTGRILTKRGNHPGQNASIRLATANIRLARIRKRDRKIKQLN